MEQKPYSALDNLIFILKKALANDKWLFVNAVAYAVVQQSDGLVAKRLHGHGGHGHHDNHYNGQVNEVELSKEPALFVDHFHKILLQLEYLPAKPVSAIIPRFDRQGNRNLRKKGVRRKAHIAPRSTVCVP